MPPEPGGGRPRPVGRPHPPGVEAAVSRALTAASCASARWSATSAAPRVSSSSSSGSTDSASPVPASSKGNMCSSLASDHRRSQALSVPFGTRRGPPSRAAGQVPRGQKARRSRSADSTRVAGDQSASRDFAKGTGVSRPPTRLTGASSQAKASSATTAATSPPKPPVRGASWATSTRDVRLTDSRTASRSHGWSERRSSTSTSAPDAGSAATASAAASAQPTAAP